MVGPVTRSTLALEFALCLCLSLRLSVSPSLRLSISPPLPLFLVLITTYLPVQCLRHPRSPAKLVPAECLLAGSLCMARAKSQGSFRLWHSRIARRRYYGRHTQDEAGTPTRDGPPQSVQALWYAPRNVPPSRVARLPRVPYGGPPWLDPWRPGHWSLCGDLPGRPLPTIRHSGHVTLSSVQPRHCLDLSPPSRVARLLGVSYDGPSRWLDPWRPEYWSPRGYALAIRRPPSQQLHPRRLTGNHKSTRYGVLPLPALFLDCRFTVRSPLHSLRALGNGYDDRHD